ncbi:MAG: TetR family transcriptional regulator [Acidobacteria bacterium]|nr:TetR family transcriptional regulator [Acidobacteriota bacterium]
MSPLVTADSDSTPQAETAGERTREALLDAAEELFLERGIDAASLRAVTSRAGANLAAVSYHFGGKEGLVQAVFDRRLRPVNEARLRLLSQVEAAAAPNPPPAEAVLRAFVEPVIRLGRQPSGEQLRFLKLMGRSFAEPGQTMRQRLRKQFQEVGERFVTALRQSFPDLPPNVLLWRFHFMLGSLLQVALHGALIAEHSEGLCDPTRGSEVGSCLVEFLLGGFGAATAQGPSRKGRSPEEEVSPPQGRHSIFAWEEGF